MLYDRREQILAMLGRDGSVKVTELVKTFGVSVETIRRDLEALEEEGLLKRVYGGAVRQGRRSVEPFWRNALCRTQPRRNASAGPPPPLFRMGM